MLMLQFQFVTPLSLILLLLTSTSTSTSTSAVQSFTATATTRMGFHEQNLAAAFHAFHVTSRTRIGIDKRRIQRSVTSVTRISVQQQQKVSTSISRTRTRTSKSESASVSSSLFLHTCTGHSHSYRNRTNRNYVLDVLGHRQIESRIRHFASSTSTQSSHSNSNSNSNSNYNNGNYSSNIDNSVEVAMQVVEETVTAATAATAATATTSSLLTKTERQERIDALNKMLQDLDIDGDEIAQALHKSLTTMEGFDTKFGKSAIKTYKTFIDPKPSKVEQIRAQDVMVAASRCARQIDFLVKRHRSHETDWVRHTDVRQVNDGSNSAERNENGQYDKTKMRRFPIIIILDNVRSAFNVGSIFRTADACGCAHIFTTGITPSPSGRGKEKLAKSALGADREVPSKHFSTTREAISYIRQEMAGWTIIGMETTDKSQCYTDVEYPGSGSYVVQQNESSIREGVVLVLGNEVTGVDTEIMPLLDLIVEIPMFGSKNSLNIAACAPVVLYEILRQWGAVNDEKP